jgi:hypothetical protein
MEEHTVFNGMLSLPLAEYAPSLSFIGVDFVFATTKYDLFYKTIFRWLAVRKPRLLEMGLI